MVESETLKPETTIKPALNSPNLEITPGEVHIKTAAEKKAEKKEREKKKKEIEKLKASQQKKKDQITSSQLPNKEPDAVTQIEGKTINIQKFNTSFNK